MYGSYQRYVMYFSEGELVYVPTDLKRVMCQSCGGTHAVMPGDMIPYKLLSLHVAVLFIAACIVEETPVLRVAVEYGVSFQIVNSYLNVFLLFADRIHQYFKEVSPDDIPPATDRRGVAALIKEPYVEFQIGYFALNRRPCFMSKFFYGTGAPPMGAHAARASAT